MTCLWVLCVVTLSNKVYLKKLDNLEQNQISIDEVYDGFCKELIDEMSDKLPHEIVKVQVVPTNLTRKRRKHNHPWWSERLNQLLTQMCDSESSWLGSNGTRRPVLKSAYVHARKMFDRERQRCKREFWKKEQDRLLNGYENDRNKFWKSIGKIGVKQENKFKIPFETIDEKIR